MSKYSVKTVKSIAEIEQITNKWKQLYSSLHLPISYSPEWLLSWIHSYYDENIELNICLVFEGDILVAIIPFMIRKEGKRYILKFLSDSCSDYLGIPHLVSIQEDLPEIIVGVIRRLEFSHFTFSNLHSDDSSIAILGRSLAMLGLDFKAYAIEKSFYIDLDESYAAKYIAKISNRRFRYQLNAILKSWKLDFRALEAPTEDEIARLIQMHLEKWSAAGVIPQFADSRRTDFVRRVITTLSKSKQLRIFALYFNSEMVAYMLGFEKDGIYFDWNTSFDTRFIKYSPGKILLSKVIQYLQTSGFRRLEFMNGNEKYKDEWSSASRSVFCIEGGNILKKTNLPLPIITPKLSNLKSKKCFIFDLHGIIIRGNTPDPDAVNAIQSLMRAGLKVGLLTNISAFSVETISRKLSQSGLEISDKFIMTSAIATQEYLVKENVRSCLVIGGEPELQRLLVSSGITISQDAEKVDAVVVGFTKELNATQVASAYERLKIGARFICTDADNLYPTENGNFPGTGWIVSGISSVARREALVIGKPNDYSLRLLTKRLGVDLSDVVIVGDNMESDIASGKKAGITTCLLLGILNYYDDVKRLPTSQRPDFVIRALSEITSALGTE